MTNPSITCVRTFCGLTIPTLGKSFSDLIAGAVFEIFDWMVSGVWFADVVVDTGGKGVTDIDCGTLAGIWAVEVVEAVEEVMEIWAGSSCVGWFAVVVMELLMGVDVEILLVFCGEGGDSAIFRKVEMV